MQLFSDNGSVSGSGIRWGLLLTVALLVTPLALLSACGRDAGERSAPTGLTPGEFAAVIIDLREAEREVLGEDSAAARFEERKRAIMEQHGTTEDELRAFVAAHGENVPVLQQTWDTISARLKHARADLEKLEDLEDLENPAEPDPGLREGEMAPRPGPGRRALPDEIDLRGIR